VRDCGIACVFDVLPADYGRLRRGFLRTEPDFDTVSLVGSSHHRLTSAEHNEHTLVLGCPQVSLGREDEGQGI
jgi:hypothetical protein